MRKHHRELANYLRATYGVKGIRLVAGGKHQKLRWVYNGTEHSYVCGNVSDWRVVKNQRADIRQLLGPPPNQRLDDLINPTLEHMMTELKEHTITTGPSLAPPLIPETAPITIAASAKTAKAWSIKAAAYAHAPSTKPMLWLVFPLEIRKTFPAGITLKRLDAEHWTITRGGIKRFGDYTTNTVRVSQVESDLTPFSSFLVEAIEDGNEILVHVPLAGRVAPMTNSPWPKVAPLPPVAAKAAKPKPLEPAHQAAVSLTLEARMRAVNTEIRAIEAACAYRHERLPDGRLVWRAPVIE